MMTYPQAVLDWVEDNGYGSISSSRSVAGGCINNGSVLKTSSGKTCFIKMNRHTPADMFEREAEGLRALRTEDGPFVPESFLHGPDFLLMEDLNPGRRCSEYWSLFGRQLAALHNHTRSLFGFSNDNYIGSTPQPNPWTEDGHTFFAEQRLMFQARLANRRGLLASSDVRRIEDLCVLLPEIIPSQPASLSHGDLWSGNATMDKDGNPTIIDPAAHYGWAEAELAMTTLFGSFPGTFYQAYQEVRSLPPGYEDRFPIYNLYHLLNHVNLFGSGYLSQTLSTLKRIIR